MPTQGATKHAAKIEVFLRAEDCAHWRKPNAETNEPSMSESGHDPKSLVDTSSIPNIAKLARGNSVELTALGKFLGKLNDSQTRILLKLIVDSHRLRSTGLWFGQPVYWCSGVANKSYLDQWFSCVVVGMERPVRGKTRIVVSAQLGTQTTAESLLTVDKKSLLSKPAFESLRRKLEKEEKLETPKRQRGSLLSWSGKNAEQGVAPPDLNNVLERVRMA